MTLLVMTERLTYILNVSESDFLPSRANSLSRRYADWGTSWRKLRNRYHLTYQIKFGGQYHANTLCQNYCYNNGHHDSKFDYCLCSDQYLLSALPKTGE